MDLLLVVATDLRGFGDPIWFLAPVVYALLKLLSQFWGVFYIGGPSLLLNVGKVFVDSHWVCFRVDA